MTEWSPPRVPRSWLLAGIVLYVLWAAYTVIIVRQLLLGLFPLLLFGGAYVGWRLLTAFEAIADGLQRIADQRERDGENR